MALQKIGDIFVCAKTGPGCYIMHQTNCVTSKAKHMAWAVFQKYPRADVYARRKQPNHPKRSKPGTLDVSHPIISAMGQYYPGKSKYSNDSYRKRFKWFKQCLDQLAKEVPDLKELSIPHGIGCGAAGGDWKSYKAEINKWAHAHPKIKVVIYRLPSTLKQGTIDGMFKKE